MDNKKQLIIIPPMSEAVKKLHEVLEGISADENMEITFIDDLKELSQYLKNTGQCLILVSNAKKCATFLQENRSFLMKNSCKTILFTPKEIPAKTLVKFTKIGLTESILENSPPKTFLYKVKLLLRSIKTAKPQEDFEKTVKSLEQKPREEAELELKEKDKSVQEENLLDTENHNKKNQSEGETIDYGNPLKGKIKPVEENLDTHWKSDRKKSDVSPIDEEENNAVAESELSAIDMYYRGKNKNLNVTEAEEADFDKTMTELALAEEEAKKKKSSFADVIDEGSIKQKRLNISAEEEKSEKIALVELDLIADDVKPKKKADIPEEDDFDRMMAEAMAKQEAERKKNQGFKEEIGGHQIGKVKTDLEIEDIPEITQEKTYDNSELEDEKEKQIELDLITAETKKSKKNLENPTEESDPHEGEVDHIEGNMVGDKGTVDKIRTRMEGRSTYDENEDLEEDGEDDFNKRKKLDEKSGDTERAALEIEESDEKSRAKREALRSDKSENDKELREKGIELDLEPDDKRAQDKKENEDEDDKEKKKLDLALEAQERERKEKEVKPEIEKKGREFETNGFLEESPGNNVHNSSVDKIDTFYRGGEAAKKKDHDWGNLTDKKDSLELLPGKGKRDGGTAAAAGKTDLGEQTIDYRKMKEEFDMINGENSRGVVAGSGLLEPGKLINDEDAGSFKVQEIDPKSLDFSINIINSIYLKETKAKQIFALLADELINNYHCFPVFYSYKESDKKFTETFNPFLEIRDDRLNDGHREIWNEYKKDITLLDRFQEKSMTTWRCPEIKSNDDVWEDVELPSWAENELKTKRVELVFPYFDGIDRMGMAVVIFPEGIDPKAANGLLTVLEMARTLLLDTIQRYQVRPLNEEAKSEEAQPVENKKNVLGFFGGLFGKKKAG